LKKLPGNGIQIDCPVGSCSMSVYIKVWMLNSNQNSVTPRIRKAGSKLIVT
jgi:hypothetical protein